MGDQIAASLGLSGNTLEIVSGVLVLLTVLANPNGMVYGPIALIGRLGVRLGLSSGRQRQHIDLTPLEQALPMPAMLEVRDLSVRFGGVHAVRDASFDLRPGEVVGIIGPNGAGKTTLLDAVTGQVAAAGSIRLDGTDIGDWRPHRRARAGLQRSFQALELFEDLTVADNLLVACEQQTWSRWLTDLLRPGRRRLSAAAVAAIEAFELADDLDRHPEELSYGRRRVGAIARAVATGPSLLLLDEPAAGLGEDESAELGVLIRSLVANYGIGVALVEHDMALVMAICDRLVVLQDGAIIADGPPAQVADDPAVVDAYLGAPADDNTQTEVQ